jgi:hypothetical protein
MNIVFLDIDGVLNSADWCRRRPSREAWAAQMDISPEPSRHNLTAWAQRSIDPDAVERLNLLCAEADARIVISSTWGKMYPLPRLELILRERGYSGRELLGATPDKQWMPRIVGDERGRHELRRGDEIGRWLSVFGGSPQYVILDDDSDMTVHMHRLVNTDHEYGLTDTDVARAMELLA